MVVAGYVDSCGFVGRHSLVAVAEGKWRLLRGGPISALFHRSELTAGLQIRLAELRAWLQVGPAELKVEPAVGPA
jgi:hypothetical protein